MANKNREFLGGFLLKNFLNVDFAQFYYLNELKTLKKNCNWMPVLAM